MADPISIGLGVAGLVKNSYNIYKFLSDVIGSVKNAPAQAAIAATEVSELQVILWQLQNFLLRRETADKSRMALVQADQLVVVISGCVATFSEFDALLDLMGTDMKLFDRIRWLQNEKKIENLIVRIQRHKSSLSLLVSILTGETRLDMIASIERLSADVNTYYKDMLERLERLENRSVTSQSMTVPRAVSSSDTSSIQTVIHLDRDQILTPEQQGFFDFEPELERSRPYRIMNRSNSTEVSLIGSSLKGSSLVSWHSLAQFSNVSVLSLVISRSELHNPGDYMGGIAEAEGMYWRTPGGYEQIAIPEQNLVIKMLYNLGVSDDGEDRLVEAQDMWWTLDALNKRDVLRGGYVKSFRKHGEHSSSNNLMTAQLTDTGVNLLSRAI
jgi:hypothetical protein